MELYTYNSLGQLTRYRSYPNGTTSPATADYRYTYGPLGQRWSKENSLDNNLTQFYWSGSHLIGENTNGTLRRYTLDGLTPTGFIENGETYHFLRDHLGTAHEVIDSSGTTVWQADYESFGNLNETLTIVANHLRFAGQYHDRESGLYYNYFRDYDPNLGRYLQSDPIGLDAGLNTYIYVNANPLIWVDPLGLAVDTVSNTCARNPALCSDIGLGGRAAGSRTKPLGIICRFGVCNLQEQAPEEERKECEQASSDSPHPSDPNPNRNPKHDKKLNDREARNLPEHPHELKDGNSTKDLFKDNKGNIYIKPKSGAGFGEPTGINIYE